MGKIRNFRAAKEKLELLLQDKVPNAEKGSRFEVKIFFEITTSFGTKIGKSETDL